MVRKSYKVHDVEIAQADDPTKTISKNVYLNEDHHAEDGMLGFDKIPVTIVSGVAIIIDSYSEILGESASDDILDYINIGVTPDINIGDIVMLEEGAQNITITHNASSPPANSLPILLLGQVDSNLQQHKIIWLQRHPTHFQEVMNSGVIGDGGSLVIDDKNNEIITVGSATAAVNHVKISNANTGESPEISAQGDDSNVGIKLIPKGSGEIIGNVETLLLPLGDESTPIGTTGVKYTFFMPRDGKFVGAGNAQVTIAPSTSSLVLDILKEGTSIFSVKPTIAATTNFASNGVLTSDPLSFSFNDKIELTVDTLDGGGTAAGAKTCIIFYYS